MSPNQTIAEFFGEQGITFSSIDLPGEMDIGRTAEHLGDKARQLLRTVVVREESRTVIAVLPFDYLFDVKEYAMHTGGEFKVVEEPDAQRCFKNAIAPSRPPLPGRVDGRLVIDKSVLKMPQAILQASKSSRLFILDASELEKLYEECESFSFAAPPERIYAGRDSNMQSQELDLSFTATRLRQRVDETFDLPAMPEIAQDIMKLRVDPSADAQKLGEIVSRDPSLAAQVISWATSPYYGYQGKVDSVETAIARVLGFELVMNLALGISIGKSLKIPPDGPLGIRNFWKQAVYCASLSEKLCRAMPIKQRPERGLIYLSGLLHNFGHLLLGHLFPPQFALVNDTIEANPYIAVEDIEFYIMGVTHGEIGGWLMQNWHMPDELIVAVYRHHQEEFWSKHAVYSNLVLVANKLLKRIGIGDMVDTVIPESTLELLSLDKDTVDEALKNIELESEMLDVMAKQLVA